MPIQVQGGQQVGATLAQAVGANTLGHQVRVSRIGTFSITPPTSGPLSGQLLALVLLGFPLALGVLYVLCNQLRLQRSVGRRRLQM